MKSHIFLKGAAILTAAGLISKLFGAVYRIPFFRVVGSEGMGLYQMAYPLYTMLLAISSAGIPVAVSKLISESIARRDIVSVNRVFKTTLIFITVFSGLVSYILYMNAGYLANEILKDSRAYYSIVAISPAIFFVGIMSVFRGYFQGFQQMAPTASSQILEQFVRVGTVLAGAYMFLPQGVEFAAAAATFGAVTGASAGCLFLFGLYFFREKRRNVSKSYGSFPRKPLGVSKILTRITILAVPISLGGLVIPVMQTLDALTVPGRLQLAGFSVSRAAQLYGELTGGAATLVNLPTVFTISLATSMVPSVSSFLERGNIAEVNRQIDLGLAITVMVCLPAAVGLAILATPVSDLLYDCPETGVSLLYLAPAAIFLGLHQITTGILQGMGKTILPVINLLFGGFLKYILNYSLTAMPHIGIIGAALGTVGGFMLSSYLNYIFIRYYTNWRPCYRKLLLRPVIAVTIMGTVVYFMYRQLTIILGDSMATLTSILAGAILYFFILIWTGYFHQVGIGLPASLRLRR